jgi:hypothetical protein
MKEVALVRPFNRRASCAFMILILVLGLGFWRRLGRCASSTYPKKKNLFFRNSFVVLNKELPAFGMWWQCHSKTPLIQLISTIQAYKITICM